MTRSCVVVGGGPAGMILALLLARGGVRVTVLEKHGDFLRDFRGDTVHASTLTLLDELGLWPEFERLPWTPMRRMRLELDAGAVTVAEFGRLRVPHPFVAMTPQWHLLTMLAEAAAREPGFELIRHADVQETVRDAGRVRGVRYVDRSPDGDGAVRELAADLVVACDGRDSVLRDRSGLPLRSYDVRADVWWFRLSRRADDPVPGGSVRRSAAGMVILLDRGDFYQMAFPIPRGTDERLRRGPVQVLRDRLRAMHPWLGDRVDEIGSWDDVKLLNVRLDRLRRWSAPGLLCIGDAAHAMSPIGGIGINLAVQDAVAAARVLAGPLSSSGTGHDAIDRAADRVHRRRRLPTILTQTLQRVMHARGGQATSPQEALEVDGSATLPPPLRLLRWVPALTRVPARVIGIGFLPEHAPAFARRTPGHATADPGIEDVVTRQT